MLVLLEAGDQRRFAAAANMLPQRLRRPRGTSRGAFFDYYEDDAGGLALAAASYYQADHCVIVIDERCRS